ncbi:MAG: tetratricopeptide repeat protein, partial [Pyrinomonadaceae bacterium]
YYILGDAYVHLDQEQEAINAYRQVLRMRPNFVKAHFALGVASLVQGNTRGAQEQYAVLKTLSPAKASALLKLMNRQGLR